MNELDHLKKLSTIRTNAGVKFLTPAAFPGRHCPLHAAVSLCSNIKGASTLVIGTPECCTYSRNAVMKEEGDTGGLHWIYILDSNEVVFGCRDGLADAIKEMVSAGAENITLLTTCIPELIGEDIEGLIQEIQTDTKAVLNFVRLGHFKCNSHPSGIWKTLLSFGNLMTEKDTDPMLVNIMGRSPDEEHIPMPKLLEALEKRGFRLRFLAPGSDINDFINAPDAALNIVVSPYMEPLSDMMHEKFGIPCVNMCGKYGAEDIDASYAAVTDVLGTEFGDEFETIRKDNVIIYQRAAEELENMRYVMTHKNALSPLPLAIFLAGLKMVPVVIHIEELYPNDVGLAKILVSMGHDPPVCHMVNEISDANVLERLEPDMSIGEIPFGAGNITCVDRTYELYGQIGHERTILLLKRMLGAVQNKKESG